MYVSTSAAEFAFPAFVSSSNILVSGVCSLGMLNGLEARMASGMVCLMNASREGSPSSESMDWISVSEGPMCRRGSVSWGLIHSG